MRFKLILLSFSLLSFGVTGNTTPIETDVGISNVKKHVNDFYTGENNTFVLAKSYEVVGNIDFVVPVIKHNKKEVAKIGAELSKTAVYVISCGCRGSPENIYKKEK